MKNFQLTIGKETANFELPPDLKMSEIVDFLTSKGCKVFPVVQWDHIFPITVPEHEELGMSYSEWFRRFVSDW
jgi:hypothetical protein